MKIFFALLLSWCCATSIEAFSSRHDKPFRGFVNVQYLYLCPSIDDTFFVQQGTAAIGATPDGNRFNNDFDWSRGVRVGAGFGFDCREMQFYYTCLRERQEKIVSGNNLWPIVGNDSLAFNSDLVNYSGFAVSQQHFRYQNVDALLSQQISFCKAFNINILAGIEFAEIRHKEHITYSRTLLFVVDIQQEHKICGIGPELGFECEYELLKGVLWRPNKLSLTGSFKGSILAGRIKNNYRSAIIDGPANRLGNIYTANDHTIWRMIPALHTRIGLRYALCLPCIVPTIEAGYEFRSYIRGLSRIVPQNAGVSLTNYYNCDLHGVYIALAIGF